MIRVGLTGGLASGKTFVGQTLAELGCAVIRADDLGHEVLLPSGECYGRAVEHFGPDILTSNALIDRRKLAARVFGDPAELAFLNGIVHPAVIRRQEQLIEQHFAADPRSIVVVEAAILIETGSYRRFDRLIVVVCAREQQIERAMRRDKSTREEAEARLERQMPLEEKVRFADWVVDTSGTKASTVEQTHLIYEELRRLA